ncbi:acyl carrier protein [Polyangium aurulentum]|uniref:acyl carrier protein n=1 Tax=Polyangium aurulentum TaxID=2567896 RepID=UPI0010ADE594|nr:acyl carrier protein [Polyangium aurulentum]UQA57012.1 acyl carrier protein [Polyangium aurulentum]
MTTEHSKAKIAGYLARFFPGHDLREDEDIFSLGFVNSMFAMQLVTFVEHDFGITVENEDLELDNFRSINAIARLVEGKRAATAAG